MIEYTNKWNDFQIRSITNLTQTEYDNSNKYDLVKWIRYDSDKEYCISVAFLCWDTEEECMGMETVGERYFDHYEHGLTEWVKAFCERVRVEKKIENEK